MNKTTYYNIPFLASATSSNTTNNGGVINIELDRPLIVPNGADNIYIEVKNATIWNNVPNIVAGVNDQFIIEFATTVHTVTIPEGIYTVSTLTDKINIILNNDGVSVVDLIKLIPDDSEGKIVIRFNYATTQIDFRDATSSTNFRELLGYNSELVPSVLTVGVEFDIADNIAQFNNLEYFLIKCPTLCSRGLNFNSVYSGIIARVLIENVAPNSQITYDPRQTYKIPCNEIHGGDFTSISFILTDNNDNIINTKGELWSVLFMLHFETHTEVETRKFRG